MFILKKIKIKRSANGIGRLIALHGWIVLLYVLRSGVMICHSSIYLISLITSSTNGYDGSMMNGLQSLPQWESAFGHPQRGKLGLLNAIQVSFFFLLYFQHAYMYLEYWVSRELPIFTVCYRWHWSSVYNSPRSSDYVYRHCYPNGCPICRHVHWCSVSP